MIAGETRLSVQPKRMRLAANGKERPPEREDIEGREQPRHRRHGCERNTTLMAPTSIIAILNSTNVSSHANSVTNERVDIAKEPAGSPSDSLGPNQSVNGPPRRLPIL
jgi:hypothetical protein